MKVTEKKLQNIPRLSFDLFNSISTTTKKEVGGYFVVAGKFENICLFKINF